MQLLSSLKTDGSTSTAHKTQKDKVFHIPKKQVLFKGNLQLDKESLTFPRGLNLCLI